MDYSAYAPILEQIERLRRQSKANQAREADDDWYVTSGAGIVGGSGGGLAGGPFGLAGGAAAGIGLGALYAGGDYHGEIARTLDDVLAYFDRFTTPTIPSQAPTPVATRKALSAIRELRALNDSPGQIFRYFSHLDRDVWLQDLPRLSEKVDPGKYDYGRVGPELLNALEQTVRQSLTNWIVERFPDYAGGSADLPPAYRSLEDELIRDREGRPVKTDLVALPDEPVPAAYAPEPPEPPASLSAPKVETPDQRQRPRQDFRQDRVNPYRLEREERRISGQALRPVPGSPAPAWGDVERGWGGGRSDSAPRQDQSDGDGAPADPRRPGDNQGGALRPPTGAGRKRGGSPILQARLALKTEDGASDPLLASAKPAPKAASTAPARRAAERAVGADNLPLAIDRVGRRQGLAARSALEDILDGLDASKARDAAMGAYADLLNDRSKGDDAEADLAIAALPEALSSTQEIAGAMGRRRKSGKPFYLTSEAFRGAVRDSISRGLKRRGEREGRFSFSG